MAKPENGRWSVAVIANQYPGAAPFSVLLPGNEPDGNCNRYCAYAPTGVGATISGFSNASKVDRTTVLTRLAAMLKAVYEELKTDKRYYTKHKYGGVVPCYANTGNAMQNQNPPAGLNYSIYHFFNYNNGEMLLHCDVIANHFHNSASAFDVTGVANNVQSPWHLWTALQQGRRGWAVSRSTCGRRRGRFVALRRSRRRDLSDPDVAAIFCRDCPT